MREQLNLRQKDIDWGRREGKTEERAEVRAQEINVFQLMLQEGKITQEQIEYFLNRMEEEDKKKEQKSSANINKQ